MEDQSDDMDSLFEGMVLFTPQQLSEPPPPPPPPQHEPAEQLLPTPSPSPPPQLKTVPSLSSEPLDENLFSDLTLVAPLESSPENGHQLSTAASVDAAAIAVDSIAPREIHSVARQVSRKKKRAAGLRIGYGRHEIEPEPSPPSVQVDAIPLEGRSERENLRVDSVDSQNDRTKQSNDVPSVATENSDRTSVGLRSDADTVTSSKVSSDTSSREAENIGKDSVISQSEKENLVEESVIAPEGTADKDSDVDGDDHAKGNDDSIEAKFELVKAEVSGKLEQASELAASLSVAKKESIRKRRKAGERVTLSSIKLKELEKSLEEACEAEDFEMAESLSDSIAASDKEKQALVDALRDAEAECDAIDAKMQQVLEAQIAAEEECVSLLENFSMEASSSADLILEKAKSLYSEEMKRWLSSTEALEGKKMELEIESHLMSEAREVLNSSIEHSVDDDRREKEALCQKKDKLLDELEKLLALVKEKEKEIAENDSKVEAVEKRIASVVAGFEETQSTIVLNYARVQSSLSEIDLENKALSEKKEEIDEFLAQEEENGSKIREISNICANEAKAYHEVAGLRKGLMLSTLKFRENKQGLVKAEEKLSDDAQKLREEASLARASLQELSSTKSSLQQDIVSFEQRIIFIDKRLPELETEKKAAAAARNFKEAARIAADAKSLNMEKEGLQTDEERTTLQLGKLEEEIVETIKRLQETEEQILSKEKELAMARIQRLLITAGAAKAERDAALELGDVEEANLLLAEAEEAESEAKRLIPVYDFKEEEFKDLPKHFIPMELVSNLGGKQLAELSASAHLAKD